MKRGVVGLVILTLSSPVLADDGFLSWLFSLERKNELAKIVDDDYEEECGACHYAYPPGLLPARSWKKLMAPTALEDHFGDNAELDEEMRIKLETLLVNNAADKSHYKRAKKIIVSLRDEEAPMRITEVRFFRRKHHDLEDKHVKENKKVKSLSYCDKCHRKAKDWIFDDDTVDIPNFGKWTW